METIYTKYYHSPIGYLKITAKAEAIVAISFSDNIGENSQGNEPAVIGQCIEELAAYFQKKRKEFSVKIALEGIDFQKQVWNELIKIPFGKILPLNQFSNPAGSKIDRRDFET